MVWEKQMTLNNFIKKIKGFESLESSKKIDYFAYFKLFHCDNDGVKPKDITECFELLNSIPYSNISSYLNKSALRGKNQKFIKKNGLYKIESSYCSLLKQNIEIDLIPIPSNNLFPLNIFENTRGYLVEFANEASCCYDYGLYNSCFFMLRKLLETLVIELFESRKLEAQIKNGSGGYFFLSDLITKMAGEKSWHLTKIVKEDILKIKKLADSSVHSKRFSAKKTDIDNLKTEIRIILQELVNLIDYPNWPKS